MSSFEEALLDFDINFLHPSVITANKPILDKLRKQVHLCKKKVIGTDVLLKNHYVCKEKLETKEVMFLTAKEECKQVCIDYQDILEKYTQSSKNLEALKKQYEEISLKCTVYQNQYEGMKSHATQLQMLVKEHESNIEALKIEKHLEKNNADDYEKNLTSKENEIQVLLKYLKSLSKDNSFKLVRKKLHARHKSILDKYENLKSISSDDDSASDSGNEQPDFFDDSPHLPLFASPEDSARNKIENDVFECQTTHLSRHIEANKLQMCIKKDSARYNDDNDSDFNNEVVSEDTGRGSSLAFSDGEKCFNSPDYFSDDSPISKDNLAHEKPIMVDTGTSPIRSHERDCDARRPCIYEDEGDINNLEYFITDIPLSNEIVTIKEKRKLIDIGTSPIKELERVHIATSPLLFNECIEQDVCEGKSTSDARNCQTNYVNDKCQDNSNRRGVEDSVPAVIGKHTKINVLSSQCELEISGKSIEERKCLERYNSITFCDETSNDGEIESILNSMRLTQRLITPIPKTPVERSKVERRKLQEIVRDNLTLEKENTIMANIVDLKKEMMDIKCLLKNHILSNEKCRAEIVSNGSNNNVSTEIFDDASRETIIVNTNDNSNSENEESEVTSFSNALRNEVFEHDTLQKASRDCGFNTHDVPKIVISPPTNNTREQELRTDDVNNVAYVTKNDSRESITFEEDLISEGESDIIINRIVDHTVHDLSTERCKKKKSKTKKLSKLDKFKKKVLPKPKILRCSPIRKLRSKARLCPAIKLTKVDATAILNNKSAYEHAAKVMAEIKSKEKGSANKTRIIRTRKVKKVVDYKNDQGNDGCLERQQDAPKKVENNPEKHIRRKSNDQHCDKHLELFEDVDFSPITTRSRTRKLSNINCVSPTKMDTDEAIKFEERRKRLKRGATDSPIVSSKRVLRSSSNRENLIDLDTVKKAESNETNSASSKIQNYELCVSSNEKLSIKDSITTSPKQIQDRKLLNTENDKQNNNFRNKNDKRSSNSPEKIQHRKLSRDKNYDHNESDNAKNNYSIRDPRKLYKADSIIEESNECADTDVDPSQISHPKQSIFCRMLQKHGRGNTKSFNKKVPDNIINSICKKLEDDVAAINELPSGKVKPAMNKLVNEIQNWNMKHFMLGFMKYLKDPGRKTELFNKVNSPPAPAMTKSEQVLLYVVRQLETQRPNTVNLILTYIEFSLFQLNRTPDFDVIESLSHFYALLCRYFGLKSRLRLFLLDAMYCVQFKVVPLIKQCLDVWMHILPLAHMGIAKSPLVTCLVYLLHFYKCEDRFNRVQEIRTILSRKYFYEITDWNEKKILDMFKNAILEVRDIPIEKKMLRMALIILGKRQGPKWCQKNIIKNMLMPMIEKEDISIKTKQFCVQLLGALLKPFPADMKVHFEIAVNHLHDMLQQDPPDPMKEAIFTSLIYINHHNPNRVIRSLLSWMPTQVSPEFEELLRDYVRGKPLHAWKKILSRITM